MRAAPAVLPLALSLLTPSAMAAAADPHTMGSSSNAFAVDLYRSLSARPGNLALSPASLSIALTMAWAGAHGETADQMARVLHLSGTPGDVMGPAGDLLRRMNDPARTAYTLRVANRLFAEKTYTLQKPYLDRLAGLGAPLEPIDFKAAADPSRRRINEWVARQTADRIRDLMPPGAADAETRLVLVNALYLLADWLRPFTPSATRKAPFHATATASQDVPTMHQLGQFPFAAMDGVKLLEMAYVGGELAMTVVLPDDPAGLRALEDRLDAPRLASWTSALKSERVSVALPKFTIDPPQALSLASELQALGMPLAFDRRRADFTGIAAPPRPDDRLVLSRVFHKAFVKVDEKGTEAAAATALEFQRAGAAMQPAPPKEFRADHPFLFIIRDLRSGMILFLGRVTEPRTT